MTERGKKKMAKQAEEAASPKRGRKRGEKVDCPHCGGPAESKGTRFYRHVNQEVRRFSCSLCRRYHMRDPKTLAVLTPPPREKNGDVKRQAPRRIRSADMEDQVAQLFGLNVSKLQVKEGVSRDRITVRPLTEDELRFLSPDEREIAVTLTKRAALTSAILTVLRNRAGDKARTIAATGAS